MHHIYEELYIAYFFPNKFDTLDRGYMAHLSLKINRIENKGVYFHFTLCRLVSLRYTDIDNKCLKENVYTDELIRNVVKTFWQNNTSLNVCERRRVIFCWSIPQAEISCPFYPDKALYWTKLNVINKTRTGGGGVTCHDFGYGRAAGVPGSHPIHIHGEVKKQTLLRGLFKKFCYALDIT